jgi:hypothetical protein
MEREMQMDEDPFGSEATADPQIPKALLPRAADSELAQRATALADRVAGYGASTGAFASRSGTSGAR